MKALSLPLLVLVLAAPLRAQGDRAPIPRSPFVQGLQREIDELRRRADEEAQRFARLIRLKVAWDLLLPFDPAMLLAGTDPGEHSLEELSQELAHQLDEEARLKQRFVAAGGSEVEPRLPLPTNRVAVAPPDPAPVPAGPVGPRTQPEPAPGPLGPAGPLAIDSGLGPLREVTELAGPRLDPSAALDPFGQGAARARLAPVPYLVKRVRALLAAGMTAEALALLRRETGTDDEAAAPAGPGAAKPAAGAEPAAPVGIEPVHLYLLARAHEKLGDLDAAKTAYQRLLELDRGRDAGGQEVFGMWARSANFALQHLQWMSENLPLDLPDPKRLK